MVRCPQCGCSVESSLDLIYPDGICSHCFEWIYKIRDDARTDYRSDLPRRKAELRLEPGYLRKEKCPLCGYVTLSGLDEHLQTDHLMRNRDISYHDS